MTCQATSCFRNPATPNLATTRVFGRDQAEVSHQLPRVLKTCEVPYLCRNGYRYNEADAAQGLQGFDNRTKAPFLDVHLDLFREAFNARVRVGNCINVILEHHLRGWMVKPNSTEPAAVALRPTLFPRIRPTSSQKQALEVLTRFASHLNRGGTSSHQISDRLMTRIRHPHRCQLTCAMELGEHDRISSIGLYAVSGANRNKRRSYDRAEMTYFSQSAVCLEAARPGFIAKVKFTCPILRQLFRQRPKAGYSIWNRTV